MDAISSSAPTTNHHLLQCAHQQQLAYYFLVASADCSSPQAPGGGGASRHHHHQHLAPAGARAGKKRRSRASKRAPCTTYISTDLSNFRLMVQHITGVQQADPSLSLLDNSLLMTDHRHQQEQQPPCYFPTLDSWNVSML